MKKTLNLKNPLTFNEKLQWLKLFYYNSDKYSKYVDKILVKDLVEKKLGKEYVIKTLGIWDDFDDIDFNMLPNKFVLKTNHNSGGIYICKDKTQIDLKKARNIIEKSLKTNYYYQHREFPYKNIIPKIIAEEYLIDESGYELKDYKIFCFNGSPKFFFIASNRPVDTRFDFYDTNFNHLPFVQGHPISNKKIEKPIGFSHMIDLAQQLSKGFPQVRVDFYNINGKIYFGELTFTHFAAIIPFKPKKWDLKLGEMLDISYLLKINKN